MKDEYTIHADMGSMKVMFSGGSCFFDNGIGDVDFKAIISDTELKASFENAEHVGHFTVIKKAWLMAYDCSNDKKDRLHEFTKGRYFVSVNPDKCVFYIYKYDEDINA